MWIVGIDIAKRTHEAVIVDQDGNIVTKPFSFPNTSAGFAKLLRAVELLNAQDAQVVFGMEATGHYWFALYAHLCQRGFTVHVMNPIQSDALRGLYIRQTKNDSRDAFIVAEVIRFGRYTSTQLPVSDLLALRELCRHRFYFVDCTSDLKRKVIALLDQVFPEYEKLFSDIFGKSSVDLLMECTTPDEIAALPTDRLCSILETASRGRLGHDKAQQIHQAAANSFGIMLIADTLGLLIRQMLEQISFLEAQIATLDAAIAQKLEPFNTPLTTISGIGPVLAAVVLSEIGDISRFDSPAKLAAFAGVDPTLKQSGEFSGAKAKMSKRGSPYLRRALWLAAFSALRTDPALQAFYDTKRKQGKIHSVAMGHLCRKMVSIVFAVLRDNKPYVPALSSHSSP